MTFMHKLIGSSGTTSDLSFIRLQYQEPDWDGVDIKLTLLTKFANYRKDVVFHTSPTMQDEILSFLREYSKDYI